MNLKQIKTNYFTFITPLKWKNLIGMTVLHISGIYAIFYSLPTSKLSTWIFSIAVGQLGGLAVTIGAHRLWTHNTYKAHVPLRVLLMCLYMCTGQYSLESWVRDHRTHHKFADTDADPHNARRGFFFSHCGWLMMKRHPEVLSKGKLIDISDLRRDPVITFHQKYFVPLFIFFMFMPSFVPYYFFNESLHNVFWGCFMFRYMLQLNLTFIVNSFAHLYGTKPYNKNILAVENAGVSIFTHGEGWHNYHHVFPWDYRLGEYGVKFKSGSKVIELFAMLGLAYDLKYAPEDMIRRVLAKNGNLKYQEVSVEEVEVFNKKKMGKGKVEELFEEKEIKVAEEERKNR